MKRLTTLAAVAALTLGAAGSAHAQGGVQPSAGDVVTTDNITHLGTFKQLGDGVGARVIGDVLYATSTTGLFVFDISDPANPEQLGNFTVDVEFENEDVPTNGKILGISASTFGINCADAPSGCLNLYDVSDPENIELIKSVEMQDPAHTMECVLDCTWFYGSEGQIVDARDPAEAVETDANWADLAIDQGYDVRQVSASPHDVTEVAPGIVLSSSQPMVLMSLRPEHGGSPEAPVVIASGTNEDLRFIHSTLWPRQGKDKFILAGGETVLGPVGNGGGPCNDEIAAFMTWEHSGVTDGADGWFKGGTLSLIDEIRPYNGTYTDGGHPVDAFGCSTHWFDDHPTFRNGGLVLVSAYEHGTRLRQVTPDGKIVEQGYALPIAGATSAPYWAEDGKHFYTLDYQRGMDIWAYDGENFQGPADPEKPGAGGEPQAPALELGVKAARATRSALRRGLKVRVTCSRACDVRATLARGRTRLARASRRDVTASTLKLKVRRKLRRGQRLRLTVTAKAADGRSATARLNLKVR